MKKETPESKAQLGRRHKISRQMVGKYCNLGMPVRADGLVDPGVADAWIAENIDKSVGTSGLTEARTRKENALAGLRELELRKRQGELLEYSQVKAEWSKLLTTFKNKMLYIPGKVARSLAGAKDDRERMVILDKEIKEALSILSNYDPEEKP